MPCSKWTAPARWMPGKNQTGCVNSNLSNRPKSHGGLVESPEASLDDVSPSARMPPSELDTSDARDWNCKQHREKIWKKINGKNEHEHISTQTLLWKKSAQRKSQKPLEFSFMIYCRKMYEMPFVESEWVSECHY